MPVLRADTARVNAAFTTRVGGVSRPPFDSLNVNYSERPDGDDPRDRDENRRRAGATIGSSGAWDRLRQVHGTRVVRAREAKVVPEADALWTDERAVTIAVIGADCMPIVLSGAKGIAAAHAGWKGTVAGVIEAAAASVAATDAWVGPSIGPCCYVVDDERRDAFRECFGRDAIAGDALDLWASAAIAASRAGVKRVRVAELCTKCSPELFYSYRRDGAPHGGQAAIARLP